MDRVGLEDTMEDGQVLSESEALNLITLDEALSRLTEFNPMGAEVVEYRFFGGLSNKEVAEVLGTSEMTVRRRWNASKTWLKAELEEHAADAVAAPPPASGS